MYYIGKINTGVPPGLGGGTSDFLGGGLDKPLDRLTKKSGGLGLVGSAHWLCGKI